MRSVLLVGLVLVAGTACGREIPSEKAGDSGAVPVPAGDTLVLTTADSAEIWLTSSRADTSAAGDVCIERTLEIRRGGGKIPVPLLYTIGAPEVVNDSTVRAALYRHCVPSVWYLVNLRTGQPERAAL